jgi:hypothetical protein
VLVLGRKGVLDGAMVGVIEGVRVGVMLGVSVVVLVTICGVRLRFGVGVMSVPVGVIV